MSREERKLRKHFEERAKRELRKARKHRSPEDSVRSLGSSPGLVVETGPGFCDVLFAGDRVRCRSSLDVATGDQVWFSPERRRVEEVAPRRTVLSRSDPDNPRIERVIAANIDVVVNVVSLKSPPMRPGLIDRYLIAIGKSGAEALVCVNKIDLLESPDEFEPLVPYQNLGIPVICCSAATGEGIEQLSDALAGKLCVFAGHSGVGKSSLLNALVSDLSIETGAVSQGNHKGRHTTTSSALYDLPNGAMIIDTPGIREFGLWDIDAVDLRRYFHEFEGRQCAFADCSHTHEPNCGVKDAPDIAPARYESYVRILQTMR